MKKQNTEHCTRVWYIRSLKLCMCCHTGKIPYHKIDEKITCEWLSKKEGVESSSCSAFKEKPAPRAVYACGVKCI
jgi:hypothetical protein